ncbi:hypothetical protein APT58_15190 (plasmid) [Corynebacterium glutamicum]|nr:hypothetical protein APT58_15190 [Corynebacterium glutamicum]
MLDEGGAEAAECFVVDAHGCVHFDGAAPQKLPARMMSPQEALSATVLLQHLCRELGATVLRRGHESMKMA